MGTPDHHSARALKALDNAWASATPDEMAAYAALAQAEMTAVSFSPIRFAPAADPQLSPWPPAPHVQGPPR